MRNDIVFVCRVCKSLGLLTPSHTNNMDKGKKNRQEDEIYRTYKWYIVPSSIQLHFT